MAKFLKLKGIIQDNTKLLNSLVEQDSLILCRNQSKGSQQTVRFAQLYHNNSTFWNLKSQWEYYIRKDYVETLLKEGGSKNNTLYRPVAELMGCQFDQVEKMAPHERVEKLNDSIEKAETILHKKKASSKEISETLIESSLYSALINKVTLEEPLDSVNLEHRRNAIGVFKKTESLMSNLVEILTRDFNYSDALMVLDDSTTGVTAKHMARVFIQSMGVLHFIHNQVEYSGLNTWIIGRYQNYKLLYDRLFPFINASRYTMHHILMEPIRLNEETFKSFSLGIMLHDIGKKKNISYFEGNRSYDRQIIQSHATDGYKMIKQNSLYSPEVSAIAGLHHEYYGHSSGYGVYRESLKRFQSEKNDQAIFNGLLTLNYKNLTQFKAFAFIPAKILEIVDVYDALVDPAREYKDPMSPVDALKLMKDEMIVEELKLDPILFDLFVKYLKQKGEI